MTSLAGQMFPRQALSHDLRRGQTKWKLYDRERADGNPARSDDNSISAQVIAGPPYGDRVENRVGGIVIRVVQLLRSGRKDEVVAGERLAAAPIDRVRPVGRRRVGTKRGARRLRELRIRRFISHRRTTIQTRRLTTRMPTRLRSRGKNRTQ